MKRVVAISVSFVALALLLLTPSGSSADEGEFASATIDIGVVVSDLDKSVEFYTKAIGFKEVEGFTAPAELVGDAGLADYETLKIRVLVLGDDESATRLKLMHVPGVESKESDNAFIHSQLGYSYLTVHVTDTAAAVKRLKKAGARPLRKGPTALPKSLAEGVFLTVVPDPDGNLVELVGPKK